MRVWAFMLLLLAAAGCGGDGETRVCFGSAAFCGDLVGPNSSPQADAGPDRQATAGDEVQLDASASFDSDGQITGFAWAQESGPPVALQDATSAVASFVAPDVDAERLLVFQLVVTDDDGASDTDRVRATVIPGSGAALQNGLALLRTRLRPEPVLSSGECDRCAFLGLWLGARVLAASSEDTDIDRLLDELRVIEILLTAHTSAATATPPPDALFRLGQLEVAAFTETRDPGTAERARELLGSAEMPNRKRWVPALVSAGLGLAAADASLPERIRAARRLLSGDGPASAEQVAAATLILATQPALLMPSERQNR